MMKKLTLIVMALMMVLGLSQCRKPVLTKVTKTITFTTNGGNSKGDFVDATGELKLAWDGNDVLHVYASKDGSSFNEENGRYIGVMQMQSHEGYNAVFSSKLTLESNDKYLRFLYAGQHLTVTDGATAVSYANQNGIILDENTNSIGNDVIASIDLPVSEDGNYNADLLVKSAVVLFDLSMFDAETPVIMKNIQKDKLILSSNGKVDYTLENGGDITLTKANNKYYTILLPQTKSTVFFVQDSKIYCQYISDKVNAGLFYTQSATGTPYTPVVFEGNINGSDANNEYNDGWGN